MLINSPPQQSPPIGIFDSGIGGLAVAKAIKDLLPHETLCYLGDTKNLPYGEKKQTTIQRYTQHAVGFLIRKKCKVIVIACNSATAATYTEYPQYIRNGIPLFNVIEPVIQDVKRIYASKKIGLIGTTYTIKSGVYNKALTPNGISLQELATPQLVPMIEDRFFKEPIDTTILHNYLGNPELAHIKALILGCTHYLLIKKEIASYYTDPFPIIDTATLTAQAVKDFLQDNQLTNTTSVGTNQDLFMASKLTPTFEQAVKYLSGNRGISVQL